MNVHGSHTPVKVVGERSIRLPPSLGAASNDAVTTVDVRMTCETGRVKAGTWRGLALEHALDEAAAPPETTHLLVTADDGHRVCIDLWTALDAVLAYERVDDDMAAPNRLVGPDLAALRSIKAVATIEAIELPADATREEYEDLAV
jgi:DMSO/TMAO reductase YedYZ molybdopterin-dependent catalytic subunit